MKSDRASYSLRSTANEIGADAESRFELDGVEFISRAFADEILAQAMENDFVLDVSEADEDVKKMVTIVIQSREKVNISNPTVEGLEDFEI